ncbi:DUF4233 domain-containing protein [Streptomonospora sp. DSM 45055]|uniref:DUF4233 domain-containing protein n=2 Tax=Streptomonospora wellingtoniae TaxID=3075544 RepID=A0ABU2KPK2_9ACTN|nr:DUF4233 domain-containing protein [Streptomonospora sp. DSM 45055]MDT0301201.1 DUF4233 domain-containing protein [Streptomonospora sp. DSM 45055]
MRRMCAMVLSLEFIVILLAVPVAVQIVGIPPATAGGVWGGLSLGALVLSMLQRFAWAHYAGWVLQAAFLATGFVVPGLAVLGVLFLALWVTAVMLGRRTDAQEAAQARRAQQESPGEAGAAG